MLFLQRFFYLLYSVKSPRSLNCCLIAAIQCLFQKASGGSRKQKYETFIKVCKKFKPVFRHFFLENFPEPTDWYQHRLSYTHSVSTNSIGKVDFLLQIGVH